MKQQEPSSAVYMHFQSKAKLTNHVLPWDVYNSCFILKSIKAISKINVFDRIESSHKVLFLYWIT